MKKTLYFEGAGCEGTQRNDVENCRIRTAFTNNDGKKIYLELMSGAIPEGHLYVDFCHYITLDKDDCNESRIKEVERQLNGLSYTKVDILKLVNEKLNCSFDEIVILPWLSGYYVHEKTARGCNKYSLMEDFTNIPERTVEREHVYKEVAKEYFENIYKEHIEKNPKSAHLLSKYGTWSLVSMDDKTMTLKSHTYKELIDDDQRIKVFEINY